jgi:nickel/cobalt transporter (NicO) family protein
MHICVGTIMFIGVGNSVANASVTQLRRLSMSLLVAVLALVPLGSRADTVASLLGNFTINQYCGLRLSNKTVTVHYVVVYGQLPALRELHAADTDGNGVTSQEERDDYVGNLAPRIADQLLLKVNGVRIPLHATDWSTSLPTEQGGFSLRIDVDFSAEQALASDATLSLEFTNQNYAGRLGWREIVVEKDAGISIFDTNAFASSLTRGLSEALQSLPEAGPLDERTVHLSYTSAVAPAGAIFLAARPIDYSPRINSSGNEVRANVTTLSDTAWIKKKTRSLVDSISAPRVDAHIVIFALLGALLLGAVHALSPGHGKTIIGAYLIGSRGTPRHAVFLGLTVTVTHTAGVFVLGFATLYVSRFIVPERLFPILSLLSAALVFGMGAVLLLQRSGLAQRAFFPAMRVSSLAFQPVTAAAARSEGRRGLVFAPAYRTAHGHQPTDATMHSHGGGPMHSHLPPCTPGDKISWRGLLALGISGGLVPCPSAMVLLLAAVAINKTAYGMFLVIGFSLGLAITLTAVGMAFLYARHRLPRRRTDARWPQLLPVMSAATITVLGLGLCIVALKSLGS